MDEKTGTRASPLTGLSLQQKLPLLMGSLITALIIAGVVGSYLEVRRAALAATDARVTTVSEWLSESVGGNIETRLASLGGVADTSSVVRGALSGGIADSTAIDSLLDRLRSRTDSGLPVELWTDRGERIAATGRTDLIETNPPPVETAFSATAPRIGPLFRQDTAVFYHAFVPVRDGDRPIGMIRITRRIVGSPGTSRFEQMLQVGSVYVTNDAGDVWITVRGVPVEGAPIPPDSTTLSGERDGVRVLRHAISIKNSPWVAVIETPLDSTLAMASRFLKRAAVVGLLLGALGVALAWFVSRRVISPIRQLDAAAAAIAKGAYDKRVAIDRGDELGRLGNTFNLMAERVQEAHSELAVRYDEAQGLAVELEMSNEQLIEAVDVAEDARLHAQEANRTKSEFLATMSHEIRTPINAMIGYTDLLEMGVPGTLTDQQGRFVMRIRDSGRHLVSLVDELLDFAKIESNEMRIEEEAFSTRGAADAAVSALLSAAHRKGIMLSLDCTDDHAFRGDSRRVHQIMLNLLNNAIKFTDAGGAVSVRCGVGTPPLGSMDAEEAVYLEVADTGIGIPEDHLQRIFEPFVQVTGGYTRQHGGAGLGLTISQKLAHLMGGVVTVASMSGNGAAFTLWLLPAGERVAAQ